MGHKPIKLQGYNPMPAARPVVRFLTGIEEVEKIRVGHIKSAKKTRFVSEKTRVPGIELKIAWRLCDEGVMVRLRHGKKEQFLVVFASPENSPRVIDHLDKIEFYP